MRQRGFTLLEMLVATVVMGVAVVSLLAAVSTSMRNAARLTDYDRAALLARSKMEELLVTPRLPLRSDMAGGFDPSLLGGVEGGWRARVVPFLMPPRPVGGIPALDQVRLQVWWKAGDQERTFNLNAYRTRVLSAQDIAAMAAGAP